MPNGRQGRTTAQAANRGRGGIRLRKVAGPNHVPATPPARSIACAKNIGRNGSACRGRGGGGLVAGEGEEDAADGAPGGHDEGETHGDGAGFAEGGAGSFEEGGQGDVAQAKTAGDGGNGADGVGHLGGQEVVAGADLGFAVGAAQAEDQAGQETVHEDGPQERLEHLQAAGPVEVEGADEAAD